MTVCLLCLHSYRKTKNSNCIYLWSKSSPEICLDSTHSPVILWCVLISGYVDTTTRSHRTVLSAECTQVIRSFISHWGCHVTHVHSTLRCDVIVLLSSLVDTNHRFGALTRLCTTKISNTTLITWSQDLWHLTWPLFRWWPWKTLLTLTQTCLITFACSTSQNFVNFTE